MSDLSRLGTQAAELMEHIASTYGEDAEIRTVLLCVEVDSGRHTEILTSGDDRPWLQLAFLEEAIASVEAQRDILSLREDDDD